MEFIVEPSLRQHFAIPHPSPDYEYVLSRTPDVFVGGSCRLVPVIQLLCALMADSFQRKGLPLPPWRREAAMLSKWLPHPARTRDRPVLSSSIAAAASAIFIPAVDDGANPAAAAAATVAALRCDCFPATSNPAAAQEGFSDMLPSDLRVSLNDSSGASTDSSGGFAGCVPLDGSPVSVLRLPGAATGHGEEGGEAEAADRPPPMTALVEDLPAASNIRKFVPTVRHHPRDVVEPPAPVKGIGSAPAAAQLGPIGRAKSDSTDLVAAATSADGPPQPMAPTLAPAAFEHYHGAEETLPQTDARPTWSSAPERGPAGLPPDPDPRCSDEDSSGCSSGDDDSCTYEEGGESDSADRAGLLSLQMQKHQHQRQPLPRSTAAARELGRIRTHPPVHRGEMAIRVVKLVGFSASGSLERHRPPAPQLQPQLHQAVARAALTGAGSAVALGRDLRTSWKARQRAV
ncbi:hypothetical protein Vretifemale_4232 [Volvox reticuliferus]|nr:hypothetical protein Vretifemale_4232 [Volvox reticuliferus]